MSKLSIVISSFFVLVTYLGVADSAAAQGLANVCQGDNCSACHFVEIANSGIQWLIGVVTILFAVLMMYAGYGLVTSGGNPSALQSAKDKFVNALIGFVIVLAAWLMVDTLIRGLVGTEGELRGGLFWAQVECWEQTDPDELPEAVFEDSAPSVWMLPSAGGACQFGFALDAFGSCVPVPSSVQPDASGNCPIGYSRSGLDSCTFQTGGTVPPSAGGSCPAGYRFDAFGDCEFDSSNVTTNDAMKPIFNPTQGGSSLVKAGAAERMQSTLSGPFARLQQGFGRSIVINDALAKAGSSRETETKGSRHFYGDALDLSTRGMSDADKIRLFREAKKAGFTGFGFGNNILHVDTGAKRAWSYGNDTYGGVGVENLKAEARQ